jgi:NAD(P)-dependent dehydrogenase (short-subunit alcohol dehydrogenase family)
MARFAQKVALVTGGGTGIGKATALAFAREGARVVIGNRNAQRGEEVVAEIRKFGGEAIFQPTDVTSEREVEGLVKLAVSKYGRIDAAFNNSGTEGTPGPIAEQTVDQYKQIFDTNVLGVLLCMKHQIRQMVAQGGGGAIVNNGSIAASIGMPAAGVYVASKHAVLGLSRSAALEVALQGVRINVVSPAAIDTGMLDRFVGAIGATKDAFAGSHPIGRVGRPEEIATAVLWLCSPEASFMVGHDLRVDGGYTVP